MVDRPGQFYHCLTGSGELMIVVQSPCGMVQGYPRPQGSNTSCGSSYGGNPWIVRLGAGVDSMEA
jgi:hypothetical protein